MFRSEVKEKPRDRLTGDAIIVTPPSWGLISLFLLSVLCVSAVFFAFASYSRTEIVNGELTPAKGVTAIVPARNGTVVEVAVAEGQRVEAGDMLVLIRTEEDSEGSFSSAEQVSQAISRQDDFLVSQMQASKDAGEARRRQLNARKESYQAQIEQIQSQIEVQEDLIEKARTDLERANRVAERGFVSQRDIQVREEALLGRRQGLFKLNQELSRERAAIIETERLSLQAIAEARVAEAELARTRAEVRQRAATASGARAYAIRAPVDGTATSIVAREGQMASQRGVLMEVIPSDAKMQAELDIPSAAIGFVKKGQIVSLSIDAFPYQRFGTVKGKILTVSQSALIEDGSIGGMIPTYKAQVELETETITAFGVKRPLVSGMTLSARIVTERQSLAQWLFEPLYAVSQR